MMRLGVKFLCKNAKNMLLKIIKHKSLYLNLLNIAFDNTMDETESKKIKRLIKILCNQYDRYFSQCQNIEKELSEGNCKIAFEICLENLDWQLSMKKGLGLKVSKFFHTSDIYKIKEFYDQLMNARSINSQTKIWTVDHLRGYRQVDTKDQLYD
eukprot:403352452